MNPPDLRYTREHEWVTLGEGGLARVGITHHAQDQLGDIVYFDLPTVGTQVEQSQKFGEVESVKAVSELFAPLSGTVVEVNEALRESPELVNEAPYGRGWLLLLEPSNVRELENLMTVQEYERYLATP